MAHLSGHSARKQVLPPVAKTGFTKIRTWKRHGKRHWTENETKVSKEYEKYELIKY